MRKVGTVLLGILVFVVAFAIGAISKTAPKSWAKKYTVEWSEEIGTVQTDFSYGDKPAEKFDLYLPADKGKKNYGLVVYLHAGGFTSGDKSDDKNMLEWLCAQGYVAAGINYTLFSEENLDANIYTQSEEIKQAMPIVVAEAEKLGYHIDRMAISGGSAGGTLAMLYAYRDAKDVPVPVKLMFEAVGPASFYPEDWKSYGLDQDTEDVKAAAAGLFGTMVGQEIKPEMFGTAEYEELIKPISGYMWVNKDSVPSVVAYGKYDRICPFDSSTHLKKALEENNVPHAFFELPHSGHALQNDDKIYQQYMEAVEAYLEKYMGEEITLGPRIIPIFAISV